MPGIGCQVTDQKPTLSSTLADFAAFLRRPQVLAPLGRRGPGNLTRWGWLTLTMVAVLIAVLLPFLQAWQRLFALPSPEAFGQMPKAWLVPAVVVIAPVAEELLFRGWQSGRAAALWLLVCAGIGAAALVLMTMPGQSLTALGLLLAALVAAAIGWWKLRRRTQPIGWFTRSYPAIFYLAAAVFALIHLGNYPSVSLLALPMVLPQLWAALVLGHMRQRIGLIPAIAAHAVANSCTLGLAYALG